MAEIARSGASASSASSSSSGPNPAHSGHFFPSGPSVSSATDPPPRLPTQSHIVRTYATNYAPSESGSEYEFDVSETAQNEADLEVDDIVTELGHNQEYMDREINPPSGEASLWVLKPQTWLATDETNVVLINKPTASKMSQKLLNPHIYRNVGNVGTLDDLATLLKTPSDWEEKYNRIVANVYIVQLFNSFMDLPFETPESYIQFHFAGLVANVAFALGVSLSFESENPIIVGGILARYEYDMRSKCDPNFVNPFNGCSYLASEVKTHRALPFGHVWYYSSRGGQTLSALYAFNCPTFLFSQKQWKLFVENDERNAIFTFPYDNADNRTPHVNSTLFQLMGPTFLKAIVICLLSERNCLLKSMKQLSLTTSSQIKATPQKKKNLLTRFLNALQNTTRTSARLQANSQRGKIKQPSFISDCIDGKPVYSTIRVCSPEQVARIDEEIAKQEKAGINPQSSLVTLI